MNPTALFTSTVLMLDWLEQLAIARRYRPWKAHTDGR